MKKLNQYIKQTFGTDILIKGVPKEHLGGLPLYIGKTYKLYKTILFDQELLLIETRYPDDFSIARTEKHFVLLKNLLSKKVILVMNELTSYNRKRLIEKGINFIVPGKQLYLPEILIDLRESFVHPKTKRDNEKLLPSAQFLLLYHILHRDVALEQYSFKELARKLNYTQMAITKAVENLKHNELIKVEGAKSKFICFTMDRAELWNTIEKRNLYVNPVLKRVFVDEKPNGINLPLCNTSALTEFTNMNPGRQIYLAIDKNEFYDLQKRTALVNANDQEGEYCLEVWKYKPLGLVAGLPEIDNIVDPLSLYISLKDTQDERIEMALEQIIEKFIW